jgi:cytochrome P450
VAKAFTVRRIDLLRLRIEEIVEDLIDRGIADLVTDLAWPLPTTVICELLGVPAEDHDRFRDWTEATLALSGVDRMVEARAQLNTYLASLVAKRREEPTDDLLSALVTARDEGDRLSEEELVRLGHVVHACLDQGPLRSKTGVGLVFLV